MIDQVKHEKEMLDLIFTHQQQEHQKIKVEHIGSESNHTDLFTKSLPKYSFQKHVKAIGLKKQFELP